MNCPRRHIPVRPRCAADSGAAQGDRRRDGTPVPHSCSKPETLDGLEKAMRLTTPLLALTLIAGTGLAAYADEKLPPDQQAKVEAMLKQEGFTKWKEIELDDGMIEVDDAIDANGKQFDLHLDPKTLAIVKRKAE
jgi:hypothetical protein